MERDRATRIEFIGGKAPSLEQLQGWIGWRVSDLNGSAVGRVEDVLRDERGSPSWLLVSEFRFGDGRRFMVPVADAVGGGGHVFSPHRRERIRLTARISGPRVTRQADRRLRSHYGSEQRAA